MKCLCSSALIKQNFNGEQITLSIISGTIISIKSVTKEHSKIKQSDLLLGFVCSVY
jgi:hypothetical protein